MNQRPTPPSGYWTNPKRVALAVNLGSVFLADGMVTNALHMAETFWFERNENGEPKRAGIPKTQWLENGLSEELIRLGFFLEVDGEIFATGEPFKFRETRILNSKQKGSRSAKRRSGKSKRIKYPKEFQELWDSWVRPGGNRQETFELYQELVVKTGNQELFESAAQAYCEANRSKTGEDRKWIPSLGKYIENNYWKTSITPRKQKDEVVDRTEDGADFSSDIWEGKDIPRCG